jgi:hypothetical protein
MYSQVNDDHNSLRNELIAGTVEHAVSKNDFYRKFYEGIETSSVCSIKDLPRLPPVGKSVIRDAGAVARTVGFEDLYLQNTSGSTALPLVIYRSHQEAVFIKKFFLELLGTLIPSPRPIALSLGDHYHGTPTAIPTTAFVLQSAVRDDQLLEYTLHLLRNSYDLPGCEKRVSLLNGPLSQISALTSFVCVNNFPPEQFAIEYVTVTSSYLTKRWRNLIKSTWNAHIFDRYSMSEVFGGATFCSNCDGFHFDPYVVPELVCPVSLKPIRQGPGLLLLTSLYPFVQAHPLIRYITGDLFQANHTSCCAETSYRFLGRQIHALFDPRHLKELLIAETDVLEVLDPLPYVHRTLPSRDITCLRDNRSTGRPVVQGRVKKRDNKLFIQLEVELMVAPQLFPAQSASLEDSICAEFLARSSTLASLCSSREAQFNIKVCPPTPKKACTIQGIKQFAPLWCHIDD